MSRSLPFDLPSTARRDFLKLGAGMLPAVLSPPLLAAASAPGASGSLGFTGIAPSTADELRVPPGYVAQVLLRWGEPVGSNMGMPEFKPNGGNSAAEQALQAGMQFDGMHFFPIREGVSDHGLLVLNHEYTEEHLLQAGGPKDWTAEKVAKSMHAVGVSVVEAKLEKGQWKVVRPSRYARRVHLSTPMRISGPAAGHTLMRTPFDPAGTQVLGTTMNCAQGRTPWGTYLTCEENTMVYFGASAPMQVNAALARYGYRAQGYGLPHAAFEKRFDMSQAPNEPNRFGWVVEIDPFEPGSIPVKRTALGRMRHEAAGLSVGADRRCAWYLTDDEPFEHLYKFVARDPWQPAKREANRDLLDHGTLYVARFDSNGKGEWLPLVQGSGPLTAANGFPDQATVMIHTRLAATALGATAMDRTEGASVHPVTREVFIACTNNTARGAPNGKEGANPANPRVANFFGHILRINEAGGDVGATRFDWGFFALAGNPALADANLKGNIRGDAFGSPDNLYVDARGLLWIQTDAPVERGPYAGLGNNQMLAGDPASGEVRRFLTAPRGAEVAGCVLSPDARSLFVNIQHPGDGSTWPDGGVPRSSTVVVRRADGGVIGS
jgi:secreted PhoX family phosphatase